MKNATTISITLTNVELALGNGTQTLVTVTDRVRLDPLFNDGIAATITASLELAPSLSQDFSFAGARHAARSTRAPWPSRYVQGQPPAY